MRVTIFGSGYVGLVTGACLADAGNHVVCVDVDAGKIERLKRGEVPIHEPGLEALIKRNAEAGRIEFTTDAAKGVEHGLFQLIAVGTPPGEDGSADLRHVLAVARTIATHLNRYCIVITKSTVPVGTADKVRAEIERTLAARGAKVEFDVVSNPEFLKEGAAIADFMKPDRVVVGTDNPRTTELMRALYEPFTRNHDRLIVMDIRSAELTKYAANAMLATKISFMNELANIAERVGADIEKVRIGIGSDPRIGYSFIYPGHRLRRLVLPEGRAGADPLRAPGGPRARDPQRRRGGQRAAEGGAVPQDDAPLRRRAHGAHRRAVGARLQAQHRRHARGALAHAHRPAAARPARACAPTIRWPPPRRSASTRAWPASRSRRTPTRRPRAPMRSRSSPSGRSSAVPDFDRLREVLKSAGHLRRPQSLRSGDGEPLRVHLLRDRPRQAARRPPERATPKDTNDADTSHSLGRRRHAALAAVARALSEAAAGAHRHAHHAAADGAASRGPGRRRARHRVQRSTPLPGRRAAAAAEDRAARHRARARRAQHRPRDRARGARGAQGRQRRAIRIRCCWYCRPIT